MKKKTLALLLALVLVFGAAVGGTIAYLTDNDTVTNTFTVGEVDITLDEADVDEYGAAVQGANRVKANNYKLIPGHTYIKDPTVTVLKGSEESYVKMTVTFSKASELDAIFTPNGANLTNIFNGYDSTNWIAKGNTEDTAKNTRTYEFWYKDTVAASTDNVALDALFDSITVPDEITKEQLDAIKDMSITVNAYAIQADGFDTAADAWAKFGA